MSGVSGAAIAPVVQIAIQKTANPTNLPIGGGPVTYTYTVTNPGNVALTDITVSDDHCATVTYVSGDANADQALDQHRAHVLAPEQRAGTPVGTGETQQQPRHARPGAAGSDGDVLRPLPAGDFRRHQLLGAA